MTTKLYKKDFQLIANEINGLACMKERKACCAVIISVAKKFNKSFDKDRFIDACGVIIKRS